MNGGMATHETGERHGGFDDLRVSAHELEIERRVEYARRGEALDVFAAVSIADDGRYAQFHAVQFGHHPLQFHHRVLELVHSVELHSNSFHLNWIYYFDFHSIFIRFEL